MKSMKEYIDQQMEAAFEFKQKLMADHSLRDQLVMVASWCVTSYQHEGRIFCAGNGGSAGDAQHIAAEFVSRFAYDRPGLAAEALTVNTSSLTAIANDYSYDYIFARQIEANARKGDIFIAISTSGNSKNIVAAAEAARKKGVRVIGMTGESGGKLKDLCDHCFRMPSSDTPRIQEGHILVGHILCGLIESALFPK